MKKLFTLSLLIFAFVSPSAAQITIGSADLPHANDTFRLSIGQITPGINATLTGPAFTWDFSQLMPTGQRVDSFIDESATSTVFSIVFIDNSFNTNRANQATGSDDFSLGTFISLTGVFDFFYNSNASYKQVGLGANVNGIPLPISFSPHDIIYKFPLNYPSLDSSASGYAVDLVSTIGVYYKVDKTRKNDVDGWGSLTTPLGTFNVLRVHTTIVEKDSLYLDTLGVGFNLPTITSHEYKWLGAGQGIPLLQINTTAAGAITQILYKDSVRSLVNIAELDQTLEDFKIYPNPSPGTSTISYSLKQSSLVGMELISVDGKVFNGFKTEKQVSGLHTCKINFREQNITAGNYLVRLEVDGRSYVRPLIITDSK